MESLIASTFAAPGWSPDVGSGRAGPGRSAATRTAPAAPAAPAAPVAPVGLVGPVLDRARRAAFKRDGYVVVDHLLSAAEVEHLRLVYDELFAELAGRPDANVCQSTAKANARIEILNCSKYRPELLRTPLYTKALGLARQLLGPGANFWGDFALCKPAGDGGPTPWHQDEAHWSADHVFNHLTVWVPLQDVSVANGCMSFVPGSHRRSIVDHRAKGASGCAKLEAPGVDPAAAVPCPMPAGAVSAHHCRTLHAAGPNPSAGPRRAYILNFGTPMRPRRLWRKRSFPWQAARLATSSHSLPPAAMGK